VRPAARLGLRLVQSLALPATIVVLWQLASTAQLINPVFFPAPLAVWTSLGQLADPGPMRDGVRVTVESMLVGWVVAGAVGIVAGMLIGRSALIARAAGPTLEFLRATPPSIIVPVLILFLGTGQRMEVAVIVFAAIWPVLLNTVHGVRSTDAVLLEAAATLRLSRLAMVYKIVLPSAVPSILVGLRISLAISLIAAVVAEILGSSGGLGTFIVFARSRFQSPDIYASLVVLGVIGYLSNGLLRLAERRALRRTSAVGAIAAEG
jgi:sulfonate transport system permease protein